MGTAAAPRLPHPLFRAPLQSSVRPHTALRFRLARSPTPRHLPVCLLDWAPSVTRHTTTARVSCHYLRRRLRAMAVSLTTTSALQDGRRYGAAWHTSVFHAHHTPPPRAHRTALHCNGSNVAAGGGRGWAHVSSSIRGRFGHRRVHLALHPHLTPYSRARCFMPASAVDTFHSLAPPRALPRALPRLHTTSNGCCTHLRPASHRLTPREHGDAFPYARDCNTHARVTAGHAAHAVYACHAHL